MQKTKTIRTNYHVSSVLHANDKDDIFLPPNETFEFTLTYPLSVEPRFKVKTGKNGMGTQALVHKIAKAYEKIYKNPEGYGIWGHDISDLYIEQICVNYKTKKIDVSMGS